MPQDSARTPRLPPRWFIMLFWKAHRAWFRVTGGRRGLWPARTQRWGALRLTTIGRRSGQERARLWDRWRSLDKDLDGYARRRSTQTAVVVLEPKTKTD